VSVTYEALLLDAGGVLVLPDPTVLGPLLAPYGGDPSTEAHHRAHYAAMAAKSRAAGGETDWDDYDAAYVVAIGVAEPDRRDAGAALRRTHDPSLWRWPIVESVASLAALSDAGVPIGVVSNASGQIQEVLRRLNVCQVGDGHATPVRCVVDSHVVGVAKPDPRIFDHAIECFDGVERHRIVYVGDSVAIDVAGARAAGLTPVLLDPYDDHAGADFARITSLAELLC
jgi:putative hydrolase of the HAD superfamily